MYINSFSVWITIGLALCIAEFIKPNVWITFIMGLSALIVAVFSHNLSIPSQIAVWVGAQLCIWQIINILTIITNLLSHQDLDSQD